MEKGAPPRRRRITSAPLARAGPRPLVGAFSRPHMAHDPWLPSLAGLRGRIGLFGGSFDPVHRAHVEVARTAQVARALQRVVFLPAARNPHKPGGARASEADRLAMLRLALAEEADLFVSPLEIERAGISYTVDTLEAVRHQVDPAAELYLVLGSDCLPAFPRWHRIERILELATPLVVERSGFARSDLAGLLPALGAERLARIEEGFLDREPLAASSTRIRTGFGGDGAASAADLSPAVARFIAEHGLYR